jgi:putative DNA primase/helicase
VTADLFGLDVPDVPVIEANPAPILAGTAERNAHELNGSLKNVSGLGAAEGAEADCASLHPFGDVPDVPDVPPNNGAGSSAAGGTRLTSALAEIAATAGEGGDTEETVVPSVPEDDRPCFKVYDDWTLLDTGRKLRPGVWLHGMSKPKKEEMPVPVDTWVCGPLHIEAQTFDGGETTSGGCCASRTRRAAGVRGRCRWSC